MTTPSGALQYFVMSMRYVLDDSSEEGTRKGIEVIEARRTSKQVAIEDVKIISGIFHRKAWIREVAA